MGTRKQLFHSAKEVAAEYNIALLGALGVGKSALTVKYLTKRFIMEYDPHLEDIYSKIETVDGQLVNIRIMDTCDKEGNDPDRYLKWAHGFLIIYSITCRPSFDCARANLETVSQYQRITGKDLPVALVGNKMDLERYRTVSKAGGQNLATQYDCAFYECSAAEDLDSVLSVFHEMVREISRVTERQMPLQPLFISEDKGMTSSMTSRNTAVRRTKSPKSQDAKERKDEKEKLLPRRPPSTFKIFNKSFKIFN